MPFLRRRHQLKSWTFICLITVLAGTSPAEAGLIPRTYNAIFGYGPYQTNYGYGPSPYSAGYPAYSTNRMPVSSYYGPSDWGWGGFSGYSTGYGYSAGYGAGFYTNAACDPCGQVCNPCGQTCNPCGGNACNQCGSGDCVGGACGDPCGASYAPSIKNGPTPEPTPTEKKTPTPPQSNPPTYRNDPPADEFRPVPRGNDARPSIPNQTIPNGGNTPNPGVNPGNSTIPPFNSSAPPANPQTPAQPTPNLKPDMGTPGSTIPAIPSTTPSVTPPGSIMPDSGFIPPAREPAPADGTSNLLKIPTGDRSPAPNGNDNDVLPEPVKQPESAQQPAPAKQPEPVRPEPLPFNPGASVRPMPMESELGLVANVSIRRQRVILDRADDAPRVVRLTVQPQTVVELTPDTLAQK